MCQHLRLLRRAGCERALRFLGAGEEQEAEGLETSSRLIIDEGRGGLALLGECCDPQERTLFVGTWNMGEAVTAAVPVSTAVAAHCCVLTDAWSHCFREGSGTAHRGGSWLGAALGCGAFHFERAHKFCTCDRRTASAPINHLRLQYTIAHFERWPRTSGRRSAEVAARRREWRCAESIRGAMSSRVRRGVCRAGDY